MSGDKKEPEDTGLNEEVVDIENINEDEKMQPEAFEDKPKKKRGLKKGQKIKRSEEHNKKIAEALTGRNLSEEHKAAISESMYGNVNAGFK
jgi:hypothetical protein